MLYYLFDYLYKTYHIPGLGVFQFISFRAGAAALISLLIAMIFGGKLIEVLRKLQVGESIRDLGLQGQMEKKGTPTMGGFIILAAILIPTLLFAKLNNIYIILMLVSTIWLGAIGFLDDYIKIFRKNKEGLAGRFKITGQVGLALIIGFTMYNHDSIVIRQEVTEKNVSDAQISYHIKKDRTILTQDVQSTKTTVPFYKNHEFDYGKVVKFLGEGYERYTLMVFMLFTIIIITAVSNGANLTDGI